MLLSDNRGVEKEKSARFDLAATEKRFFKFIDLEIWFGREPRHYQFSGHIEPGHPTTCHFKLRTDQERGGITEMLTGAELDNEKQYFATLVIHGKNANSRRLDLTIQAMIDGTLRVIEADTTASYRKEVSHEKQS